MPEVQPPTMPEPAATLTFSTQTETTPQLSDLSILPEAPGYEIVRTIGRGGMGIVYEARDKSLNRTVALKMILMGPHASEKDRQRFRQEAEAVAQLQHPGIVQIYEIGESPTGPFLALEYVGGGSLSEKLDGKPWLPLAAAELLEHVTRAVEAAHQAGIIHRDLKPANILLQAAINRPSNHDTPTNGQRTESDKPDVRGEVTAHDSQLPSPSRISVPESRTPKITDFGLAKRLDSAHHTASGAILGTPSYMAPEQAEGRSSAIGPATDVYALGAVLYELLTGRPPFVAETAFDTIMQVAKQDPVPPSRLNPKIPADLETICLKCLRKEKDRRYLSATALAEDLRCYREGRPIAARSIGSIERCWRWCRRNPMVAALLSLVALLLVAGASVATYFAVQANDQWKDAQNSAEIAKRHSEIARKNAAEAIDAHKEADRHLYAARISLAQNALRENRLLRLRQLLQETTPAEGAEDHRGWEWYYLQRQASMENSKHVLMPGADVVPGSVALAADAARCAAVYVHSLPDGSHQVSLVVHDINFGKKLLELTQDQIMMTTVALSPDGNYLAESLTTKVRIRDLRKISDPPKEIELPKGKLAQALAFDGSAKRLAVAEGSSIKVFDVATGKLVGGNIAAAAGSFVYQMAFDDKNGRLFFGQMKASGTAYDSEVFFAELADGKVSATSGPIAREPFALFAVNRVGQTVAIALGKKRVLIWDHRKREAVHTVPVLTESITAISFVGPQMFAIGGANGLVSLYHANGADEPVVLRSHANPVVAISATKTGHYFSLDTSAEGCTWDAVRIERQRILAQGFEPAGLLAQPTFGPSGSVLVHVGGSSLARSIWVWDVVEQKLRFKRSPQIGRGGLGMLVGKTAVSGNERVAAAVLVRHENADVFGNAAGVLPGLAMRFGGPGPLPRALLDVGAQLLRSDTDAVRLIDLHGNLQYANVKLPEAAHQLFLSSDGQHVLTAGAGWRVHETANGTQVCGLDKREAMLSIAALHPDGQQYAVAVSRNGRTTAQGRGTPQIESPRAAIVLRSFAANDETTLALTAEEETCSIMQMQFSSTGLYLWAAAFNNGANRSQAVGLNLRLLVWKRDDAGHYQRIGVPNDGRLAAHLREAIVVAINEGDGTIACGIRTGPQSAEARVGKFDASRFESIFRFQSGDIEFAGITADGKRLLVVSGTGGGSDSHGAELRVFDLIGKQELLEISLGRVIGAPGGGPSGYHFDGGSLRVAAWNDRGAEMRIIDGAPTR